MTRAEKRNRVAFHKLVAEARKHITGETHHFTIAMHGVVEEDFPSYGIVKDFHGWKTVKVYTDPDNTLVSPELTLFS
jgi:hypothetical protein